MRGLLVLPFALAATATFAQDGVYVGIGTGTFDYEESFIEPIIGRVGDQVQVSKLFGGFEINDHFAFEIDIAKTHYIREFGSENIPPFGDVTDFLKLDFTITSVRAIGQLPFDWGGVFFGGLGFFSADLGFAETLTATCCDPATDSGSINDDGMTAAAGFEWRFGRFGARYGVRLQYEWWDMSDADASAVGIALSYGF